MKEQIIFFFLIIILGYIASQFIDWWIVAPVAGLCGVFMKGSSIRAFITGFLAILVLYITIAYLQNTANQGILANRMGALLGDTSPMILILISGILGGFVSGLACLTGNLGRKAFVKE